MRNAVECEFLRQSKYFSVSLFERWLFEETDKKSFTALSHRNTSSASFKQTVEHVEEFSHGFFVCVKKDNVADFVRAGLSFILCVFVNHNSFTTLSHLKK